MKLKDYLIDDTGGKSIIESVEKKLNGTKTSNIPILDHIPKVNSKQEFDDNIEDLRDRKIYWNLKNFVAEAEIPSHQRDIRKAKNFIMKKIDEKYFDPDRVQTATIYIDENGKLNINDGQTTASICYARGEDWLPVMVETGMNPQMAAKQFTSMNGTAHSRSLSPLDRLWADYDGSREPIYVALVQSLQKAGLLPTPVTQHEFKTSKVLINTAGVAVDKLKNWAGCINSNAAKAEIETLTKALYICANLYPNEKKFHSKLFGSIFYPLLKANPHFNEKHFLANWERWRSYEFHNQKTSAPANSQQELIGSSGRWLDINDHSMRDIVQIYNKQVRSSSGGKKITWQYIKPSTGKLVIHGKP